MHDLELHGGEHRATICDGASASILHPDKGMLHSKNPTTNLIMLLAQSSNPCISLAGIDSLVWAIIELSAIFEVVFTKLVCASLDLILCDTGWMQAVKNWFGPSEIPMR